MRRLVPPHIVSLAQSRESHHVSAGSALIIDAAGSTALSERLQPYGNEGAEALANILSAVFAPMVERVTSQGGIVAEIAGDGVLALFPGALDVAVTRAVSAAIGIVDDLDAISEFGTPAGPASLSFRSVIGAGSLEWVIWSCEDPDAQQNASFVSRGGAVDEARRGEMITPGEVIAVGPAAADHLPPDVSTRPLSEGFLSIESWEETGDGSAAHSGAPPGQTPFRFYPTSIEEAALRGEFRDVVAVFVDLARPPDEPHETEITDVLSFLSRHRGYLNHLIKPEADSEGIRVFALWGAPISREHDIGYALRFLDDLRTAVGYETMRAGVTRSTAFTGFIGGALQEQYTAIGPGINLASRICTNAGWGEIRVDENIISRLGDPWRWEEVGAIDYRGFTRPVPTYRVVDVPPVLVAETAGGLFIGRRRELDQLEDLLAPLWSGRNPGVIAVTGEPGIGKSRLVVELKDRLSHRDPAPTWIQAQADEIRTQPLATLRDALAGYFGRPGHHESGRRLDEYLARLAPGEPGRGGDELKRTRIALGDLLDLAPDVERTAALDPKTRFENLVIAVNNLIGAMERAGPVIVSVADGQWVDRGTTEALRRVLDDLEDRRVAVIIESRTKELGLEREHTLEVGPLDDADIAELIEGSMGEPPSSDLVTTVADRSGGNPFYALQLVEYLRREGDLAYSGDSPVPRDMRRVLVARLDDLPHRVRRMVQSASVLGRDVDLQILEQMLEGAADLRGDVAQAVEAGVWDRTHDRSVTFTNSLIRDAAYGMLLHSDLRLLHAAAAAAIEGAPEPGAGRSAELAYHHDRAGNSSIAADHYLTAGREAADRFDNHAALVHFGHALELLPDDDRARRLETLRLQHDIYELEGERASQAATISSMENLADDDSSLVGVLILEARLHTELGEYQEADELAEQALSVVGPGATPERGELKFLKAQIARHRGRIEEAVAMASSAREIFAETAETLRVATVEDFAGGIAWETGDFEAAAGLHRSAADVFASSGRMIDEIRALNNLGTAIFSIGDYSTAREIHREGAERSRQVGYRMGEGDHLDNIGGTAWAVWDLELAIEYYTAALEIREGMADLWGIAISKGNLGAAHRALGDLHQALDLYREALEIDRRIGRRRGEAYDLHGIGLCQLGLGRNNLAAEALGHAAEIREGLEEPHLANESHVAQAVAMIRRGDTTKAAELVEQALEEEGDHFFAASMETTATRMRCIEVLSAVSPELAEEVSRRAREDVQRRAGRISDPAHRSAYLERAEAMFDEATGH